MLPPALRKAMAQVVLASLVLLLIGLLSVWSGQAWLAPSLASAAFIQILTPETPSARAWPMVAGQACGIAGGYAGVYGALAIAAPVCAPLPSPPQPRT